MAFKEQIMDVIEGGSVSAVATADGNLPAFWIMVLAGFPDMTLGGATDGVKERLEAP